VAPRLALATVWFLCLGGLGLFFPYFALYLKENAGLSGTQVGLAIALLPLVGMLAQPVWGQVADRTGARTRVLAIAAFGAAAGQLLLGAAEGFPAILAATVALAFFGAAVVPQAVSVSFAALEDPSGEAFGRVRVWGTLGFLVMVVGFPYALDVVQRRAGRSATPEISEPGLGLMFAVTAALFAAGACAALLLPRGGQQALQARRGDWRVLLRHRPVVMLLGFSLLAYLFLQGPMGIFSIYVRAQGGSMHTVGNLWILMLALEIPLVLYTGRTVARVGPRGLLLAGVAAGGLRWVVCGFADSAALMYAVQVLHGITVAGLIVGGPLYLEAAVPEHLRSTAQALFATAGAGLGGLASNAAAGWLFEHLGPEAPYRVGGLGALACGLAIALLLPAPERPADAPSRPDPGGISPSARPRPPG